MANQFRQSSTKEQALLKLKHYCAYQERCHQEVKEKLYALGLHQKDVDEVLAALIEDNYLNEERFAIQYAGGKFRINQWGKVKIKYALKQKQISDYCIQKALKEIDETSYVKAVQKLAGAKWKLLGKQGNSYAQKRKLYDYLLQKGYESELIGEVVKGL